jgi:hypothetical protein
MQMSTGRHAQTPSAMCTHAQAVIKVGQEHPFAVEEATKTEVSAVLEEVAAHDVHLKLAFLNVRE